MQYPFSNTRFNEMTRFVIWIFTRIFLQIKFWNLLFFFNVENSGSWTSTENKKKSYVILKNLFGVVHKWRHVLKGEVEDFVTTGLTTTKALIMKSVTMWEGWKNLCVVIYGRPLCCLKVAKIFPFFSFFHQMPIFFLLRQIQQRNCESLWLS